MTINALCDSKSSHFGKSTLAFLLCYFLLKLPLKLLISTKTGESFFSGQFALSP